MDTPAGPERGTLFAKIYGEDCQSINRRAILAGGLAMMTASTAARGHAVGAIGWSGRAHVEVGGRSLDLAVETRLQVPVLRVRSTSWIRAEGAAAARTLILEPDGGWVERAGARQPLPPAAAAHERQQYGLYLALLSVVQGNERGPWPRMVRDPAYPATLFRRGEGELPSAADFRVDAPEAGKPAIAEHVTFGDWRRSDGLFWPWRIDISQDGRPFFALVIDRFDAERA